MKEIQNAEQQKLLAAEPQRRQSKIVLLEETEHSSLVSSSIANHHIDDDATTSSSSRGTTSGGGASGESAGGMVRGFIRSVVSRFSIGRLPHGSAAASSSSAAKAVSVGRLPFPKGGGVAVTRGAGRSAAARSSSNILRQRVPIKTVAQVSDKISTGMDWWSTITSSSPSTTTPTSTTTTEASTAVQQQQQKSNRLLIHARRIVSVAGTIIKNTALGMAVFETYGYTVSKLASYDDDANDKEYQDLLLLPSSQKLNANNNNNERKNVKVTEDNENEQEALVLLPIDDVDTETVDHIDDYARASIRSHYMAGFVAGTVHGIASPTFEGITKLQSVSSIKEQASLVLSNTTNSIFVSSRILLYNTMHHSIAHSCLFGSYEFIKRTMLVGIHSRSRTDDDNKNEQYYFYGGGYLFSFGMAGGLAGQIQHIVSHYTELIAENAAMNSTIQPVLRNFFLLTSPPTVRSILMAFPPSAFGFIAFEYGKKMVS